MFLGTSDSGLQGLEKMQGFRIILTVGPDTEMLWIER